MGDELDNFMREFNITNSSLSLIRLNCSDLFHPLPIENFTLTLEQRQNLERAYHYIYLVCIPIVCVFGFFGNILNVVVFLKKKTHKTLDEIEYCTTICLVALAVSDMMFCFCTFPQSFVKSDRDVYTRSEFMLYYRMAAPFAINSFIMSSTMLTVLTAIMRYTAICHPFYSRQFISFRKTVLAITAVFLFSVAFNASDIWLYVIVDIDCIGPVKYIRLVDSNLLHNESFTYAHKLLWAILGNFIPLIILLYCNIRLLKALHESQKLRLLHSRDNFGCLSAHKRINITLITIIILFFVLVAPSEISKFIFISRSKTNAEHRYTYAMVSMVTNALQCINFSVNFILYYVIIAPFRKTLHEFICVLIVRRGTRDSTNSQKQQTCVLITLKEQRRALI